MKREYVARYARITESNWWVRSGHDFVHRLVLSVERTARTNLGEAPRRVLDVGTLDGALLARFDSSSVRMGVDYDLTALAQGDRKRPRTSWFSKASACQLPMESGSLSTVVSVDVLEHISDDSLALREFARVLAAGGILVLVVPGNAWLRTSRDDYLGHLRRYSRTDLEILVSGVGLRVLRSTYFAIPPALPLLLLRWLERFGALPKHRANHAGQMSSGFANSLLYGVMSLESRIARRVRLPFGSSIATVALKP